MALVYKTIALFKLSDNMKSRQNGQQELPFNFDEKGHTIEPIKRKISLKHNKYLKKILEDNPNKQEKLF